MPILSGCRLFVSSSRNRREQTEENTGNKTVWGTEMRHCALYSLLPFRSVNAGYAFQLCDDFGVAIGSFDFD